MDPGSILIAAGTFLTAVIGAIVGGVVLFMNTLHKNRQEQSARSIEEYKEIVAQLKTDLKEQSLRFERITDAQQLAINQLSQEVTDTQVELADQYGFIQRLYDVANRMSERLRSRGENPEPIPELPERPTRRDPGPEYVRRTMAQQVTLAKGIDKQNHGGTGNP